MRKKNNDFIKEGAIVYYVRPECEATPIMRGVVDTVYEDNSADINDKFLGTVNIDFDAIFETEPEAAIHYALET